MTLPSRRALRAASGVLLAAVILTLTLTGLLASPAHAATAPREAAACSAVFHYHHVNATDSGGVHAVEAERAWYHAWHEAKFADPDLRRAIRHYLAAGTGWSVIPWLCGSGQ